MPDRVHDTTRERLLEVLITKDWHQLLDLKCELFTWRSVNGRLLRWSVQESALLRDDKSDEAIALLNRVVGEIEAQLEMRGRDAAIRPLPKRIPSTATERRFVNPKPPEVITERRWEGTELGRVVNGYEQSVAARHAAGEIMAQTYSSINAKTASDMALLRRAAHGFTGVPEHLMDQFKRSHGYQDSAIAKSLRTLSESLDAVKIGNEAGFAFARALEAGRDARAQVDQISAGIARFRQNQQQLTAPNAFVQSGRWVTTNKDHPYHVAAKRLEPLLGKLSSKEWQRLAVERQADEDANVKKEINRNEVAVARAVKSLVDEGLIERCKVSGQVQVRRKDSTV